MKKMTELQAKWSSELGLDANPNSKFGAPVSFTSHLDGLLPGVTIPLNTSALANGFRTPYVIDEIRMQAYMGTPAVIALAPSRAVEFQFRTGAYACSIKHVPMTLHQPVYNNGTLNGTLPLQSNFAGGKFRYGDEARWVLAKPLWMAPGDQVQASVRRASGFANEANGPFSVDVTYVGRSLKAGTPGPKIRYVPWAAFFTHDLADAFSQTTTEFRNPFMTPLHIHKLVGKTLSKAASGLPFLNGSAMLPNDAGVAHASQEYVSIYIEDSLGYKITNGSVPVGAVFDTERCVWTFSRPIGPREQLNMQFTTNNVGVGSSNRVLGVSMLGYREEGGT